MTPDALRAGKTYVCDQGTLATIQTIIRDRHSLVMYSWRRGAEYGNGSSTAPAFARWAEREATAEEAPTADEPQR